MDNNDLPKKIIITWGFDKRTGDLYLDSYLELIGEEKELIKNIQMMEIRQRFQSTNMTLLHTPEDWTRQNIEDYVKYTPRNEVIDKFTRGEVSLRKITRKNSGSTAIEFIKDYK